MKIKVKLFPGGRMPKIEKKGDWFDVFTSEEVELNAPQAHSQHVVNNEKVRDVTFSSALIPLGFALQLPRGFEANMLPRSGAFNKFGILLVNSQGVIDNSFCGNDDQWKFGVLATQRVIIPAGTKIGQFRIRLSQKASFWNKLRWFFMCKIKFVRVDSLSNINRGGFGSTGY